MDAQTPIYPTHKWHILGLHSGGQTAYHRSHNTYCFIDCGLQGTFFFFLSRELMCTSQDNIVSIWYSHEDNTLRFDRAHINCWSLLYSAIFRSRADSLHSHVILHESLAFKSAVSNINRSGVRTLNADIAGAILNCCRLGEFCVHHTMMHHVTSCKASCILVS